jgi:hypothetical protein
MFSKVCNPNDLTLTTLVHVFSIARPRSLVLEYVGSTNHILKKLLDEFQKTPEDDKRIPRRNLIRLHSFTTGYGALAYVILTITT